MASQARDALNFALLHQSVEHHARYQPRHPAVDDGDRTITYGELREAMERLAAVLIEHGLRRHSRVGLFLDNGIDACTAMLGTLRSGACYVPIPPSFPGERNASVIIDSEPFAIVTSARYLACLPAVLAFLPAGSIPLLIVLDLDVGCLPDPALIHNFGSVLGRRELVAAASPPPAVGAIEEDYRAARAGPSGPERDPNTSEAAGLPRG